MRISVESVSAASDLAGHLERCGCIVSRVGRMMIDVSAPPRSLATEYAQLELEAYLRVWRELNPEVAVEILSEDSPSILR